MKANISDWAIRNPMPLMLLFSVLTLLGLVSFQRLPITYFPTIDIPVVTVTITAPGMQPAQMEKEVTRPMGNAAMLAATLLLFAVAIWFLSTGFFPEEDMGKITIGRIAIRIDTRRSARDIAARIGEIEGVASVFVRGGTSPTGLEKTRRAAILVNLAPKAQREPSAAQIEPLIAQP